MNRILLLSLALLIGGSAQANYIAHEWGTFTSVVGSNGKELAGMIQEDEELPEFVYNFGDADWPTTGLMPLSLFQLDGVAEPEEPNPCPDFSKIPCRFLHHQVITQKMETPVVYFYSDTPQSLSFEVQFPKGIISQSYPAPTKTLPLAIPGVELKKGAAQYDVEILSADSNRRPPQVEPTNIYAHARNTQSNLIQVGDEVEKLIFYRGIGEFSSMLSPTSVGSALELKNRGGQSIPEVLLVYTSKDGQGNITSLGALAPNEAKSLDQDFLSEFKSEVTRASFDRKARALLTQALMKDGLYADEATAMFDTWEKGYLRTPGLRVLYIMSKAEVNELLPVQLKPAASEFIRVFVGRIELLLEEDENQILADILSQGSSFNVKAMGARSLPTLLRVKELAEQKGVLTPNLNELIQDLIGRI